MNCDVSSNGGANEERTKYLFGGAELVLKVCTHGNLKLMVMLLQLLSWSKLTSEDSKLSLCNIQSCEDIANKRVKNV